MSSPILSTDAIQPVEFEVIDTYMLTSDFDQSSLLAGFLAVDADVGVD